MQSRLKLWMQIFCASDWCKRLIPTQVRSIWLSVELFISNTAICIQLGKEVLASIFMINLHLQLGCSSWTESSFRHQSTSYHMLHMICTMAFKIYLMISWKITGAFDRHIIDIQVVCFYKTNSPVIFMQKWCRKLRIFTLKCAIPVIARNMAPVPHFSTKTLHHVCWNTQFNRFLYHL